MCSHIYYSITRVFVFWGREQGVNIVDCWCYIIISMKNKIAYNVAKVLFSLIILLPVASLVGLLLGFDIDPKREYYYTDEAFEFIKVLMAAGYITAINAVVFAVSLYLIWTKRVALAAVLVFPITVNVVAFHLFLDAGLLTGGAALGNLMLIINLYFFWYHKEQYRNVLAKDLV